MKKSIYQKTHDSSDTTEAVDSNLGGHCDRRGWRGSCQYLDRIEEGQSRVVRSK